MLMYYFIERKMMMDDGTNEAIAYLKKKDKRLAKLIASVGPINKLENVDYYSFLVHEIIEQMLSKHAGRAIYYRLLSICGGTVTVDSINALCDESLLSTGMSKSKLSYIKSLNQMLSSHKLVFSDLESMSDSEVINKLKTIKGIGNWTAKMFLLFALKRPDVLPYEDTAFLQTYKWLYKTNNTEKNAIIKKCAKWSPYSSIAARYFYIALDSGLTKKPFHLYK